MDDTLRNSQPFGMNMFNADPTYLRTSSGRSLSSFYSSTVDVCTTRYVLSIFLLMCLCYECQVLIKNY
jgi:hypothetical protein